MAAVPGGDNFTLRNPRNGEVMTILPAKIIWDEIIQNAWETGEARNIVFGLNKQV